MDENLAINTNNFINNTIISPFGLDMQNLIDTVKASKKLHYDNKQKLIRFKEKADRNIVIFKDIVKKEEDFENFSNLLKMKIKEKSQDLITCLKNVEKINQNIFFNFENETYACDFEKILDDCKKNKENPYEELNYFLAAETYGRRITPNLNRNISQEEQIKIIKKVFDSQNFNDKRRNTFDNNKINKKKLSILETKQLEKSFKKQTESFKEKNNQYNKFHRNSMNIGLTKNRDYQNRTLGYTPYNPKRNSTNLNDEYSSYFNDNNSMLSNNARYYDSGYINESNSFSMFNNKNASNTNNQSQSLNTLNLTTQSNNKFDSVGKKKEEEILTEQNVKTIGIKANETNERGISSGKKLDPKHENLFDVKKCINNLSNNKRNSINESNGFSNSFFKLNPKEINQINNRGSFNYNSHINLNDINSRESFLSKLSNIHDLGFNHSNKNSFLSYGDERNFFNEIQKKNLYLNSSEKRKSSLNYMEYLKNETLNNLRSSFVSTGNNYINPKEIPFKGNQYGTSDIISVYFHMNYLKHFKFPEEFDKNFLDCIMRKEVKHSLEKFKEKDVLFRSRAKTQILKITNTIKKRSKYKTIIIIFYF